MDDDDTSSATLLHTKHKKIFTMLSQIPNEITQDLFDRLPISDCKSIVDAHIGNNDHARLSAIYGERTSLERYFTRNLCNGGKMMKLLGETDSHLFGSRVIEYFSPGVIDEFSDWNFYVSSSPRLRHHFMKRMEEFGVVWQDATSAFFRSVTSKSVSMVLKRSELDFIIEDSKRFELNEFQQMVLRYFTESSAHIPPRRHTDKILFFQGRVGTDSFECTDVTRERISSEFANILSVKGMMTFKGVKMGIEMNFTNDSEYTHHQLIHDSCFSMQQCFIGGFGALHMYGKLTASNVSYKWNRVDYLSDQSNREDTDELAHKYTLRGYEIRTRPYTKESMINNRSYCDSDSVFIPYHNRLKCDDDSWNMMQMKSCHMQWIENRFDTYFKYTKYSNYFSVHTVEQCQVLWESLTMKCSTKYLIEHGAL